MQGSAVLTQRQVLAQREEVDPQDHEETLALLAPQERVRHSRSAAELYLRLCDTGPLADLRNLLADALPHRSGDVHVTSLLGACDGSTQWTEDFGAALGGRLDCLLSYSERALSMLDSPSLREDMATGVPLTAALSSAMRSRANVSLEALPAWWRASIDEMMRQTVQLLVYSSSGNLPSSVDPSWNVYRESLRSPLFCVPYPVGKLLQAVYEMPAAALPECWSAQAFEICRTLVADHHGPLSDSILARHVTAACLLSR